MYRVALLMALPDACLEWTNTRNPLNRPGLDARQSGDQIVADSANPWHQLAIMYNNPNLPVTNLGNKYDEHGMKTMTMADPFFSDGDTNSLLSFEGKYNKVFLIEHHFNDIF